ncbi:MAG TPA: glycosyltransferase family 2 protein [Candidatus Paceibacterota bacterium]|jgi:glycosyltransferase involved in cell wall biosynthesis|nr:glycosyltransferase family 2 protein [Candidatus Paceibacterota bacterium]HOH11449.1 glycosyltransferase family 2 protein [Candidatus Paceibacterota bacterium]HOY11374.1 glycosyltransferase family 2 protein [Candidatus Paceibacterota bacterium]
MKQPNNSDSKKISVSVILPCHNEEKAIARCILEAKKVLRETNLYGEVIVSDSSSDNSRAIAQKYADRVVHHGLKGYGRAYLEGVKFATGQYLFLADADGTYDFKEIPRFISLLAEGYDLVIGNRLNKKIHNGAMPWLHRHVGSPFLSFLVRTIFGIPVYDINSGQRAITKEGWDKLNLTSPGMEFASEMIIKAKQKNLKMKEVDVAYMTRIGESKLKTLPDGLRHLFLIVKLTIRRYV